MQDKDTEKLLSLKRQGQALMQDNRLAEAQALFQEICAADAEDADAWHVLSSIYGMQGEKNPE